MRECNHAYRSVLSYSHSSSVQSQLEFYTCAFQHSCTHLSIARAFSSVCARVARRVLHLFILSLSHLSQVYGILHEFLSRQENVITKLGVFSLTLLLPLLVYVTLFPLSSKTVHYCLECLNEKPCTHQCCRL